MGGWSDDDDDVSHSELEGSLALGRYVEDTILEAIRFSTRDLKPDTILVFHKSLFLGPREAGP